MFVVKEIIMTKILVPIDFSKSSDNALDYAIGLASFLPADIILLHVESIYLYNLDSTILNNTIEDKVEISQNILKEKAVKIRKENMSISNVEYHVEAGNVEKTISDYITNYRIDFVVMSISEPKTSRAKQLFGSKVLPISKNSEAPVFVIPEDYQYKKNQTISYASEYSSDIKQYNSLFQIKFLNKLFNSKLNVLHVIPQNHVLNAIETEADLYVEETLENTNHKTFILSENKASNELLDFVTKHEIDLMVVEPKKHSFFHKLFYPSTTKEVAFKSPVPVLTIKS
jgi:nucleotide-binding universal stress UspA family protein